MGATHYEWSPSYIPTTVRTPKNNLSIILFVTQAIDMGAMYYECWDRQLSLIMSTWSGLIPSVSLLPHCLQTGNPEGVFLTVAPTSILLYCCYHLFPDFLTQIHLWTSTIPAHTTRRTFHGQLAVTNCPNLERGDLHLFLCASYTLQVMCCQSDTVLMMDTMTHMTRQDLTEANRKRQCLLLHIEPFK